MPRPSRARRILKWTGAGLSLVLLAAWGMSLYCWAEYRATPHLSIFIDSGSIGWIFTSYSSQPSSLTWHPFSRFGFHVPWYTLDQKSGQGYVHAAGCAFWLLLLLTAIPTVWLWHRDRRLFFSPPDHLICRGCGYDLTGNLSGVCSECGEKVHPPAVLADSERGEKTTIVAQAPCRQGLA